MRKSLVLTAATLACLAGCLPMERIVWSPDGKWAAVLGGDGLRICDEQGKLSDVIVPSAHVAAWLSDSKSLVVAAELPIADWDELADLLTDHQRRKTEMEARQLLDEIRQYTDDWKDFKPPHDAYSVPTIIYLRSHYDEEIASRVGELWTELSAKAVFTAAQMRLVTLKDRRPQAQPELARLARGVASIRVSPSGKAAAILAAPDWDDEDEPGAVMLLDLSDGWLRSVASSIIRPAWSADGRMLVVGNSESLGGDLFTLVLQEVADEDGKLLADLPPPQVVATGLCGVGGPWNLAMLADGTVVFPSFAASLPRGGEEDVTKGQPLLYHFRPGNPDSLAPVLDVKEQRELKAWSWAFQPSPDGRRLLLTRADWSVAVIDLETRKARLVQPPPSPAAGDREATLMLATWRTNDEVCLAVPSGSPWGTARRAEIVLVKLAPDGKEPQVRLLSKDWPKAALTGVAQETSGPPATQPATARTDEW